MSWSTALRSGLNRWCLDVGKVNTHGIQVQRLRPRCPLVILSGATPGPFYHSHPHVPSEFDHLQFDMASQVNANVETIHKIARNAARATLPFKFSGSMDFMRRPEILHWVSNRGEGFANNAAVVAETTPKALAKEGMDDANLLATFETGGNVSDRRFLLETFAMFGMDAENDLDQEQATQVRVEITEEFDPQYFMPYVAAYVVSGPADLALFSVTAASENTPGNGAGQVVAVLDKLQQVLKSLGSGFDDTILCWNRVAELDENEEAVLMTRSRMGLAKPLAESVLEVAASDPNGTSPDGIPLLLEYIVVAQIPRQ